MGTVSELRQVQVTFDAADPAALSRFWAEVLGYRLDDPPEPFATWDEALEAFGVPEHLRNSASAVHDPTGAGPRLFFQQVPEGKTAKNRVHLDVRAAPGLTGEDRTPLVNAMGVKHRPGVAVGLALASLQRERWLRTARRSDALDAV